MRADWMVGGHFGHGRHDVSEFGEDAAEAVEGGLGGQGLGDGDGGGVGVVKVGRDGLPLAGVGGLLGHEFPVAGNHGPGDGDGAVGDDAGQVQRAGATGEERAFGRWQDVR